MSVWGMNTCARPSLNSTRPSRASGFGTTSLPPGTVRRSKIVAAVQANAEVPDLMDIGGNQVNYYYNNGTLQDLTEWAKAQAVVRRDGRRPR